MRPLLWSTRNGRRKLNRSRSICTLLYNVRPELAEFQSEVFYQNRLLESEQHFAAFEEDCMAPIVEWTYPEIMAENLFIGSKTVVVGLLQAEKKDSVDIDRIKQLCDYLWNRVRRDACFEKYQSIALDAGHNAIV